MMLERLIFSRFFPVWRWIHRHKIIILMIHGVVDDRLQTTWNPLRRQLSVQKFDSGIAALAKFYHFISIEQATAILSRQAPVQPYSIVLTFDDGYRNNVTHALPILQKYGIPAIFFLSTGHIEQREPYWYDRLDFAIQHLKNEQRVSFAGKNFLFHPNNETMSRFTFSALRNRVKSARLPYTETMRKIDQIAGILEENAGCRLVDTFRNDHSTGIMSWEEAKWVADQGVTIGSHTVDHVLMDRVDEDSAREQLAVSKKAIEQHTGKQCSYFCFPNGNWDNKAVNLLRETGFTAAVTTETGANLVGDELLTLKRFNFPKVK